MESFFVCKICHTFLNLYYSTLAIVYITIPVAKNWSCCYVSLFYYNGCGCESSMLPTESSNRKMTMFMFSFLRFVDSHDLKFRTWTFIIKTKNFRFVSKYNYGLDNAFQNLKFFLLKILFWRTQVLLYGHWYPCFGLLVMSPLGFKARVGSLIQNLELAFCL